MRQGSVYDGQGLLLPSGKILQAVWQCFSKRIARPKGKGWMGGGHLFIREGIVYRLFWK